MVNVHGGSTNPHLIGMSYQSCKVGIDFIRQHFTHLDPVLFKAERLPIELFVDYNGLIKPLVRRLLKEKKENRLNSEYQGIEAVTEIRDKHGKLVQFEVFIKDYDPRIQKFFVVGKHKNLHLWRSRV